MKTKLLVFTIFAFISFNSTVAQPVVSRGPYLNIGTTTSMIVKWRTDIAADSKIWYGTTLDTASMTSIVDAGMMTEHEMNITGLSASTRYYYAIGTTTSMLAGADSGHYFQTSPPIGTQEPIRIWGIGDFGEGNSKQAAVRDAYNSYIDNGHTDVWLWFGDNAYNDGEDNELQIGAFDMYPETFPKTVLWPSLGNHDYGSTHPFSQSTPDAYLGAFTLPTAAEAGGTASNKEEYYSYDYGNVHFLSLNSEAYSFDLLGVSIEHDQAMLTWIENDLASNTNKDWIIAYLHAPPYADGTHTEYYAGVDPIKKVDGLIMRGVRDRILPILENYGVDLVIGGHSHSFERSFLTYGNYGSESPYTPDSTVVDSGSGNGSSPYLKLTTGPNANKGGVFCVIGSSAKIGSYGSDGPLNHELMIYDDYRLGSILIEIDSNQLDAYFIDTSGTAWDNFTIIKMPMPAVVVPTIVRGPYLNSGTTSSMVVRWRTDTVSDSKIWYGTSLDTASMLSMVDAASVTDHEMNVTGLTANTKYFYAIGTTTDMLAGADSGHYFVTSPVVGTKQPIRIWAVGDMGEGNSNQAAVRDAYIEYTGDGHSDVWVWLGDNAYDDGRDADYQTGAFDVYTTIFPQSVLWPALGNHDYGSAHPFFPLGPAPYMDIFTLPTAGEAGGLASGNEGYYSFDYGNVHFVNINSEEYVLDITDTSVTHDSTMLAWLESDLANNTNTDWLIAYLHATPYADGTHSENYAGSDVIKQLDGTTMRAVRDNIIPILENHGVDLVLAGHSHDYERSFFTYGNYGAGGPYPPDSTILDAGTGRLSDGSPYQKFSTGPNANKGSVFCVVGCSAKTGDYGSDGPLNHGLMIYDDYRLGSMVIDIDEDTLKAYFIDTSGTAWDNFAIVKVLPPSVPEVIKQQGSLKVYPNPFKRQFSVEYTLASDEDNVILEIVNLSGIMVYSIVNEKQIAGNYTYTIDAKKAGLSVGAYLLQLKTEGSLVVQKTIRL